MAETINIKLLIDAAESAKTVAETRKALKDLRSAALQVEEGSAAFDQITQASGKLQDKISDLSATTKFFANDMRRLEGITGIAEGIAAGFSIAQGAMALFGNENKDLEATLVRLNSVMAILNGLQSIGNLLQKESSAVLLIQNTVRKTAIALTSEQAAAEAAEAVAAGTATVAQRALNAAMNANPVALLVTAILAGVTALTLWTKQSEEAAKEEEKRKKIAEEQLRLEKERNQFVAKESGSLNSLLMALQATNEGSQQRLDLIKQINTEYGLSLKNLQDEDAFMAQVNSTIEEYITLQYNRYKLQKNQEYFDKQQEIKFAAELKIQKLIKDNIQFYAAYGITTGTAAEKLDAYRKKALDFNEELTAQELIVSKADRALESLGLRKGQLLQVETKLTEGGKKYTKQSTETTKATKDQEKAVYDLTQAYFDLAKGVSEANYDINQMSLEAGAESSDKMIALKKLENQKILDDLKLSNTERLKSFEDAYIEEEKKLKANAKVSDDILRQRAQSDAKYIDAKKTFDAEYDQKKKQLELDLTKFIDDENQKRSESSKKAAAAIITTDEFYRFIKFIDEVTLSLDDSTKKTEVTFEEYNALIKNYADVLQTTQQASATTTKQITDDFIVDIQNGGDAITKAIDEISANIYANPAYALRELFSLDQKALNDTIDAELAYTVKLGAIYQDKFKVIKAAEDKAGISFKNFNTKQNEELIQSLTKRYDALILAEDRYYNEQLFNLNSKQSAGAISNKQYLERLEALQRQHNDNLLDIDVAYGKKSSADIANRTREKIQQKATDDQKILDTQKRLNEQLLQLEATLQQSALDIFNNYQDMRSRSAERRYNQEIERIDAAQKAYEDSITERTVAEQQQLDIQAGFDEQRKNAEDALAIQQDNIKRKQFEAQKANDMATIAIQTAVAVTKTIAELGGVGAITPPGIALIAAIVAQGVVQEVAVAAKKYVPAFAEGGLVVGPGTGKSDSIDAKLSNGESVINAKSTRMFAPLLSAINQAGGGRAIPHMATGGMVMPTTTTVSDNVDFLRLEKAIYALADRPVETSIKQTQVSNAQTVATKIKNRVTFG